MSIDAQGHLPQQLTLSDALWFPLRTAEARRDVLVGGLWMFLLLIGWILNLGHRLEVVQRLYCGETPYFRGFSPLGYVFRRGLIAASAIFCYLLPTLISFSITFVLWMNASPLAWLTGVIGVMCFVVAVFTLPGCMTVYACEGNPSILAQPITAFRRAMTKRNSYLYAWLIALLSITLSLLGLLFFGVGFFFSSVWAWQVVGYVFTVSLYGHTMPAAR